MKALLPYLIVALTHSFLFASADRKPLRDLSPASMIAASQAFRAYVTTARPDAEKALSAELAIVSLTEQLIVERWRKVHEKDVKSRDAVLAETKRLRKQIEQLQLRSSSERLDRDRVKELKAAIDTAVDDFRLRLMTAFFH